jgi:putative transposase
MKNRDYKEFTSGVIVHIYNRGNNKEKIFLDDQDYKAFLFRLGLALGFDEKELNQEELLSMPCSRIRITGADKKDYKLHSFCLMPNHFHLIIEQKRDNTISNLILKICTSYAKYLNKKYKRVGHVFQDQFKSVLIESNEQLMWVSAYIHMNPVKDGFVKHPEQHKWSSYKDFTGKRNLPIVHTDLLTSIFGSKNFEKETLVLSRDMSKGTFDIL